MIRFQIGESINNATFPCGTPFHFDEGIEYVCESQMAHVICAIVGGNMAMEPVKIAKRSNDIPSSILIVRAGGAGDVLFLTPVLRALREKFPSAYIGVACSPRLHWILQGPQKIVDSLFEMPIPSSHVGRFDWVIDLEESIERVDDMHVVDVFARESGIEVADRRTIYHPSTDLAEFEKQYPKTSKRVGIQLKSSTPVRTYKRVMELQNKLETMGWERVLFTAPGEFNLPSLAFEPPPELRRIINTAQAGWSWGKTTDFMKTCDVVIGPDSSLIHFAGAMGIPAIALYGSFDAKLRVIEGSSVKVIQATRECPMAPCGFHGRRGQVFPLGGPCNQANMCTTLSSISPDEIIELMGKMGF